MYRIAIVDDNETWCFVLALRLQQKGYIVSTFTDAQSFLREVNQFDLALIDFSIPAPRYQRNLDGPEIICQIKSEMFDPPLLILISSFFTEEVISQSADLCPEADAILTKRVELGEILLLIQQLLADRSPKLVTQREISHSLVHVE